MTLYAESFQYTYVSAFADGSFLYKASYKESHACLLSLKAFGGCVLGFLNVASKGESWENRFTLK